MKNNLLPCPFCGATDPEYDNCDNGSGKWYKCNGCGVQVKVRYIDDLDAAWNRRAMHQWQPIETAPKDGGKIIVYPFFGKVVVAEHVNLPYIKKGWFVNDSSQDGLGYENVKLTHWMPLPQSPKDSND